MLYDRPLQIADIQILRNYLKHRENAVVASMRICIRERIFAENFDENVTACETEQ